MPGRGLMLTLGWLLLAQPVFAHNHTDNTSAHLHSDASFNAAVEAVRAKDYQKAVLIFEAHANAMQPDAQYNLAVLLKSGKGRPQDFRQALVWSWLAQLGEVEQAEELARDLLDMLQEDSIEEARAPRVSSSTLLSETFFRSISSTAASAASGVSASTSAMPSMIQ